MAFKLLSSNAPGKTRILYLAPYAPDLPDLLVKPYGGDGEYPEYHFSIYSLLKDIGYHVDSSSKPYSIVHAYGNVDYVFSLMNRLDINHSEIFVSAYCEFARLPYLGAPPNIRALAEDKFLSKLAAATLGIPVPKGKPYPRNTHVLTPPEFAGPYFVKDRFGAASENISESCLCDTWAAAKSKIQQFHSSGISVLLESYCPGIDITLPILGGKEPALLPVVHPHSDKLGNILTHDLKLTDHLGYQIINIGPPEIEMQQDAMALWVNLGPIDYYRADYRFDPKTGKRFFLEINICCHLGEDGAICLAGAQRGYMQRDIVDHLVQYSLARQRNMRQHCKWIL